VTDAELVTRFEALALNPAELSHREHVRLAFTVLAQERDLAAAAVRFRRMLRRFTDAHSSVKYHETITWAYLAIVAERMYGRGYASSHELLAEHADLLDHERGALARHYDVPDITASPVAKATFVLPRIS
jgi:hypothetical protein